MAEHIKKEKKYLGKMVLELFIALLNMVYLELNKLTIFYNTSYFF